MNNAGFKFAIQAALVFASGAAFAQSSVTVYGILDASVGRFKGAVTGVNATDKYVNRVDGGDMSTSRLGFRGTEDLGSGWNASFDLSTFIRNDTGASGRSEAIGAPANVAADPFWSRAAWVGLGSNDLGRVRLGNISTLLWVSSITSNPFGDSTTLSPLNLVTFVGGPLTGGTAWTNTVMYDSPEISGFSVGAAVSAAETQGGRNEGLRLGYAKGPLTGSLNWQSVNKNPLTFADGTSPNNTKTWQFGGSYDFTSVRVYGHLGQIRDAGTETAPLRVRHNVWELSAQVPVGTGFFMAGYAARKTNDSVSAVPATAPTGNKSRKVASVGYDHYLSKRTDLYVMLLRDRTETNTTPAQPHLVSASATNFALGIRHRF